MAQRSCTDYHFNLTGIVHVDTVTRDLTHKYSIDLTLRELCMPLTLDKPK